MGFMSGKRREPYFFEMRDSEPFMFAGVFDHNGFAILTTTANELMAPFHDRMPVILDPAESDAWLAGEQVPLRPYPSDRMTVRPVSIRVNSPLHDDAGCLEPRTPGRLLF